MDIFSYRIGTTGTVLNPNSTTLPFVDIEKVTGLDTPEIRTTERDHEGTHGGYLDAEFEKMRPITLEGYVYVDVNSMDSYLDQLKQDWAADNTIKQLYYQHPGVVERIVNVKTLGVRYDYNELARLGVADAQFICQAEDPRIYSSAQQTANVPIGVPITTGFGFPFGFPLSFGAAADAATTLASVGGNRPTPAVITITGPVTDPVFYNDTAGTALQFSITLGASDTLVIDTYYRTVKLNGTVSRRSSLINPGWFELTPGQNYLRYRAATGGAPAAVVTWRDAWR